VHALALAFSSQLVAQFYKFTRRRRTAYHTLTFKESIELKILELFFQCESLAAASEKPRSILPAMLTTTDVNELMRTNVKIGREGIEAPTREFSVQRQKRTMLLK
jgi:hypothetical protein